MSDKSYFMVDAGRELLLIVGHHDEGLVLTLHESVDDVLDEHTVGVVEAMKGLVEDQQLGILDEGARRLRVLGKLCSPCLQVRRYQARNDKSHTLPQKAWHRAPPSPSVHWLRCGWLGGLSDRRDAFPERRSRYVS